MTPLSLLQNPMNRIKRQKDMMLKNEPPGYMVSNMLQGKSRGKLVIALETMKWLGQNRKDCLFWTCLVGEVNFNAIKNSNE